MSRALGLLVVLAAAAPARAAEPPASLRAALRHLADRRAALETLAGPHPAFDLTYLPRPPRDVQALIAFRPNVLFAHPDLAAVVGEIDAYAGKLTAVVGGTAAGPGLAGIDQVLVCGNTTVRHDPAATNGRPNSFLVGGSGFAARTAERYDWDAAVRAWFPKAEARTHRGAAFRVLKVGRGLFPGFPFDDCEVAFYPAPDGRTLVVGSVSAVTALIDCLRVGTPVTPPPGWDRVDTAAVAVAVDNRDKRWVWTARLDEGPVATAGPNRLFLAADQFALGLDVGPTTRVRGAVYCRDPFQARHARQARREAMDRLADNLAPGRADRRDPVWEDVVALADALLKAGTATATPLGFEYAAAAPGDLIGRIVAAGKAAAAAAPAPQASNPPAFQPAAYPPAGYAPPAAGPHDQLYRGLPTLSRDIPGGPVRPLPPSAAPVCVPPPAALPAAVIPPVLPGR